MIHRELLWVVPETLVVTYLNVIVSPFAPPKKNPNNTTGGMACDARDVPEAGEGSDG